MQNNLIGVEDYDTCMMYLNGVGSSDKALQYLVMRVHRNMHHLDLSVIAAAARAAVLMEDESKAKKFLDKTQQYVSDTPAKVLMKADMPYFTSILLLYEAMQQQLIKPAFRARLETMLAAAIERADFVIEKDQLLMLIEMLSYY